MYTLFRTTPLRTLLALQAPALLISFVIAELVYKFHSFTLETLAFLATWSSDDYPGNLVEATQLGGRAGVIRTDGSQVRLLGGL